MVAELILCAKFFAFSTFGPSLKYFFKPEPRPVYIEDVFGAEMRKMNDIFEASRREFDKAMKYHEEEMNKMIAEQAKMAKDAKEGKNVEVSKDGKVVKKVENGNKRYKETTIEKTPGGFKKVVKEEYRS